MSADRPGNELLEEERWSALLGDVLDQLESVQTLYANNTIENAISSVRFVRREISRRFDPKTRARR